MSMAGDNKVSLCDGVMLEPMRLITSDLHQFQISNEFLLGQHLTMLSGFFSTGLNLLHELQYSMKGWVHHVASVSNDAQSFCTSC